MGRHNFRPRPPVPWTVTLLLAIGSVAVASTAIFFAQAHVRKLQTQGRSSAACPRTSTVRVTTSSSFAPVLSALTATLARDKYCLNLAVSIVDGRPALGPLTATGSDVWIPDDAAWELPAVVDDFAARGRAGAGTLLATSPIYFVTDRVTAERLTKAGDSWLALSRLVTGDTGVRLAVRDPAGSGDGLIGAGSVAESVWLSRGMDQATVAAVATARHSRTVTGAGPALPMKAGEVALVPEYALLPALPASANPWSVLAGKDRSALLHFTWLPTKAAVSDPDRAAALRKLLGALTSGDADGALAAARLRRPGTAGLPGVPIGRLPVVTARPFDVIAPHHVDHVFAAWYSADRRVNLQLVVDVSKSMSDPAPGSHIPLITLVARGCVSVADLLPADARIGLWEFGSLLQPPRDYKVLLPTGPLTAQYRRAVRLAASQLRALPTGTGLYDTILAAYRAVQADYQSGMPNQVLVFTDGHDESDPGGISLTQLTAALRAAADPNRPVSIAVAAFGNQSAAGVLARALTPLKDKLVRVTSAEQVTAVFVHAAVGGLR